MRTFWSTGGVLLPKSDDAVKKKKHLEREVGWNILLRVSDSRKK